MATGIVDRQPPVPGVDQALRRGLLRVCPVCDAYETQGKTVAVFCADDHSARQALFMRRYTDDVTAVFVACMESKELSKERLAELEKAGIKMRRCEAGSIILDGDAQLADNDGKIANHYDFVYSGLGVDPRADLAVKLGAKCVDGRLEVGECQETSVNGLYAAGDVVRGLNQVSTAVGEAALAATNINLRLMQMKVDSEEKPSVALAMKEKKQQESRK